MLTSGGGMRPQAGDVHLHLAFPQLCRLRANRALNGAAGAMGTRQVHAFCQDKHNILASVNIIWYRFSIFVWFPTKYIRFAVSGGAFLQLVALAPFVTLLLF